MRRATLKIAQSRIPDLDDHAAMGEALARLYRAASHTASDAVASLSASERARLAVYCYGRVHLNTIGLAIAAQCDLDHLICASSSATSGRALFEQSRDASTPADKPFHGRRPVVSLAGSVPTRPVLLIPAELPA